MNNRTLLAGVAAGVAMFIWGSISHMVLPLGDIGIGHLANEAAVVGAFKENVPASGLYYFPYSSDMAAMEELLKDRPRGLLAITQPTEPFSLGRGLGIQFVNDLVVGLLLAWLLGRAGKSLPDTGSKIVFAIVVVLLATAGYLGPFWNWYGFSLPFVLASGFDAAVGATLGAFVISRIAR